MVQIATGAERKTFRI